MTGWYMLQIPESVRAAVEQMDLRGNAPVGRFQTQLWNLEGNRSCRRLNQWRI
jgi:hypothetical protein